MVSHVAPGQPISGRRAQAKDVGNMAALTPPEPSSRYGTHRCRRLRHRGIRVNTVVPGYTETPLVTSISGQRRRTRGDRVADPAGPPRPS